MPQPDAIYTHLLADATVLRDHTHRRWSLLGNLRLAAALVAIVAAWQVWQSGGSTWLVALIVGVIAFIALAIQQRTARIQRDELAQLVSVNERALARLHHRWDELPQPSDAGVGRTHAYAHDLNIVGWASLAQRIGTIASDHGWRALYAALLHDRDLADLPQRQAAVQELAGQIDLRQAIEAVAMSDEPLPDSAPLLAWSRGANWLAGRAWLRMMAIIGPALVLIAVLLTAFGIVPWIVILLPVTLNALVFMLAGAPAAVAVQGIEPMRDVIAAYGRIMAHIGDSRAESPLLRDLAARLEGAADAMVQLGRTVNLSIPPGSMLYFPLQMTVMWDVNVLQRLEQWRSAHGAEVAGWLDAMGEWESLAALSVLAHDHPEWTLPQVDAGHDGFSSTHLLHPLLPPEIAIGNDVVIASTGRFLFVTGSNMSGKSTLLRAIGVNAVLAQAGSVVAAGSLQMPPLSIASCMRVEDSLAHGVSFFMAELQRLKAVVDHVQAGADRVSLYLLDEILQGTNTAERQIASRHVLRLLATQRAIGAVSSHDLELIEGTDLTDAAIAVHFAEQFSREDGVPQMQFDYRLRPGLATSSNAIRLMEMIGFEVPE